MSVGERMKQIRKEKGLTLDRFGESIGIKKSALSQFERGTANPSNQTILSICREYHICEEWLRTGEGPMRQTDSSDNELDAFLTKWDLPREFRGLFLAYRNLKTDRERETVRRFLRDAAAEIARENAAPHPEPVPEEPETAHREQRQPDSMAGE